MAVEFKEVDANIIALTIQFFGLLIQTFSPGLHHFKLYMIRLKYDFGYIKAWVRSVVAIKVSLTVD